MPKCNDIKSILFIGFVLVTSTLLFACKEDEKFANAEDKAVRSSQLYCLESFEQNKPSPELAEEADLEKLTTYPLSASSAELVGGVYSIDGENTVLLTAKDNSYCSVRMQNLSKATFVKQFKQWYSKEKGFATVTENEQKDGTLLIVLEGGVKAKVTVMMSVKDASESGGAFGLISIGKSKQK